MYLSGHSVQNMVQSNVYQGLEANLRLNNWKKKLVTELKFVREMGL